MVPSDPGHTAEWAAGRCVAKGFCQAPRRYPAISEVSLPALWQVFGQRL